MVCDGELPADGRAAALQWSPPDIPSTSRFDTVHEASHIRGWNVRNAMVRRFRLTATAVDRGGNGSSRVRRFAAIVCMCSAMLGACSSITAGSSDGADADQTAQAAKTSPQFNRGDWPFQPLAEPAVPGLHQLASWVRNPIDNFIGQKLEAAKLT